jgi:hypothetical protein
MFRFFVTEKSLAWMFDYEVDLGSATLEGARALARDA